MLERKLEPEVMDDPDEAAAYDAMDHTEPNRAFIERLLELGIERCEHALDLGTGPGDIPIALSTYVHAPRITAVDLAESMLMRAKIKAAMTRAVQPIAFEQMDVKALEIEDDAFDAVFSNTILHHIPDPSAMLAEAARVLRPGGLLLIRDLYRPDSIEQLTTLVDEHASDCDDAQRQMFADSLHAALTPDELRALAQQHGLGCAEVVVDTDRHMSLQCSYTES